MKMNQVKSLLVNAAANSNDFEAKSINVALIAAEENKEVVVLVHKEKNNRYILCAKVPELNNRYDCVDIATGEVKIYAASTLKRNFSRYVETLEVEEVEVPAAVEPEAVAEQPKEVESKPEQPVAANKDTYTYVAEHANRLTATIVKYFLNRGYDMRFVGKTYIKIFTCKRTVCEVYYSKTKGTVKMAVKPQANCFFQSIFPENAVTIIPSWSLSCKVSLQKDENLQDLTHFLNKVEEVFLANQK